jgi:type IV pilus assembly protein PilV
MKNNHGFTLIEVLVSVLILSTGLLGLVGLQTAGMRNVVGSYNRTQASHLASNMADRIRANMADITSATSVYTSMTTTAAQEQSSCLTTTGCDAATMAQNDLYRWQSELVDANNG